MVMGCPFDGEVQPEKVKWVVKQLLDMGCYEVSLGDTVGRGNAEKTEKLFQQLADLPHNKLAAHFHDTFDTAIENIFTAIRFGTSLLIQVAAQLILLWEDWEDARTQ